MSKVELETVVHVVKRGEKGRLITQQTNRRQVFARDCFEEFEKALGGIQQASDMIQRFKDLNRGNAYDKAMADGLVSSLIHQFQLGRVVLLEVLGVGTWRFKRIRDGQSKMVDYKRLNGLQVLMHGVIVCPEGRRRSSFSVLFADHRFHGC